MSHLAGATHFFGDANPVETRLYASLPPSVELKNCRLSGHVSGPICEYAETLSASVPLAAVRDADGALAQAIVPDPCFWTPELPFLYRVRLELHRGGELIEHSERTFGIRPLASAGRSFRFGSAAWVLRAIRATAETREQLVDCRSVDAALWVRMPDDELCSDASRLGVLIVAEVSGTEQACFDEAVRLSRHASVGIAALSPHFSDGMAAPEDWGARLRRAAPNLVFARWLDLDAARAPWSQAVVASRDQIAHNSADVQSLSCPVIAIGEWERAASSSDIPALRGACDRLQRDLAPIGQFAGYVV